MQYHAESQPGGAQQPGPAAGWNPGAPASWAQNPAQAGGDWSAGQDFMRPPGEPGSPQHNFAPHPEEEPSRGFPLRLVSAIALGLVAVVAIVFFAFGKDVLNGNGVEAQPAPEGSLIAGQLAFSMPSPAGPWVPLDPNTLGSLKEGMSNGKMTPSDVWGFTAADGASALLVIHVAKEDHIGMDAIEKDIREGTVPAGVPGAEAGLTEVESPLALNHKALESPLASGGKVVILIAELPDGSLMAVIGSTSLDPVTPEFIQGVVNPTYVGTNS